MSITNQSSAGSVVNSVLVNNINKNVRSFIDI